MPHVWVARLLISPATAQKVSSIHGIHADEVRDAIQCVRGLPFVWDDDPEKGLRAIVRVQVRHGWYEVVPDPRSPILTAVSSRLEPPTVSRQDPFREGSHKMTTNNIDDLYDDDEPAEKIHAAFERGTKGVTAPKRPRDLNRLAASIVAHTVDREPVVADHRSVRLIEPSSVQVDISDNFYEQTSVNPQLASLERVVN